MIHETRSRSKGFTLIELLVGITVTSIVFSIGYSGFREFSRRQALTGVTKAAVADLRQIQQLALTGQKPPASAGTCPKLVGYTFSRTNGGTSYDINASCDVSTGSSPDIRSRLIKSVPLNGVTFTATTASTLFKILGQGTDLSVSNNLTFTHIATNTNAIITIRVGGDVQVQ